MRLIGRAAIFVTCCVLSRSADATSAAPTAPTAATAPTTPLTVTAPTGERLVNDRCPVMTDEPATPRHETQFQGVWVRFCCDECKEKFAADPAQYLAHVPQLSAASAQAMEAAALREAGDLRAAK